MNRQIRRKFNKQNKTNYSRADFEAMELLQKIKLGEVGDEGIERLKAVNSSIINFTYNEEKVEEGREVKLNYNEIMQRPKEGITNKYLNWIEEHKDDVFHVAPKTSDKYLTLKESPLTSEAGETTWLFNATDLLYKINDDKWVDFDTAFPMENVVKN